MAEKEKMNGASDAESKHETNSGQTIPNEEHTNAFREYMCAILNSLTEFGAELKVGASLLTINANVRRSVDVSALQPSHVHACLQQHIAKLQAVSANLKQLTEGQSIAAEGEVSTGHKAEIAAAVVSEVEMEVDSEHVLPATPHCTPEERGAKCQVDENSIQIKAAKSEIDRRISAFIERKQLEINDNNVREFCNVIDCNQENSCARTDAVFTPYPGFKSHVKVTRVVNTYGPQTRTGVLGEHGEPKQSMVPRDCGNPAIEERLHNIEAHLKLPAAGPVPQSVYQRLKRLEDRILELEGLSPEYFQSTSYLHKRPKASTSQNYSLTELDGKINAVKAALLKRVSEFQSTDAGDFPF